MPSTFAFVENAVQVVPIGQSAVVAQSLTSPAAQAVAQREPPTLSARSSAPVGQVLSATTFVVPASLPYMQHTSFAGQCPATSQAQSIVMG